MIAFPVPVPGGAPPWLAVVLAVGAVAVVVVLVVQTVRYFRDHRDDDR